MKNTLQNKKAFSLIELSIVLLIIGIIIAGVTQSSRLISSFKLNSARTITQSSAVHSIKDLVLWLEPVMENSFANAAGSYSINNGDKVSLWNDYNSQISQKINLAQSTASSCSACPTYVSSGINNLPTIQFNGGQFLDTLNTSPVPTPPIPAGNKQYTIFAVWQTSNFSSVGVILHQRGPVSCNGDRAGFYVASGSLNTWACGFGDTTVSGSVSLNRPYLSIYRVDNTISTTTNNVKSYLNGTQSATTSATFLPIGNSAFVVGFGDTGNTYYYNGYISEIIVFARALKSDEIADIRAYIAKKYNFGA